MASKPLLTAPPVLSTPESHIFEDPTPIVDVSSLPQLSDEEFIVRYEINRTLAEIREGGWRKIALQFPDGMVKDAVRVYRFLKRGLASERKQQFSKPEAQPEKALEHDVAELEINDGKAPTASSEKADEQLSILADTSYGSCCVDEIAAEHVDAEVVVHYGRSCLSPTARLPVIYVFTEQSLDVDLATKAFGATYPDKSQKVILMGDLPFHSHLAAFANALRREGHKAILVPEVEHNPSSLLPNRSLPGQKGDHEELLKQHALFHIGQPPAALLLTLTSRVSSIHIYGGDFNPTAQLAMAAPSLRRRYALLTSTSTVSIFGILINTLSVKNYLHIVSHVQKLISQAGKKSYTFVVGKVNPAKVANFEEIGGWVVIGCWESSLVESREFYKPLITPFELELALMKDSERVWSGDWRSDFETVLRNEVEAAQSTSAQGEDEDEDDEDESAPPEFDLRTGRYVSHSRPMAVRKAQSNGASNGEQKKDGQRSLIKRANGELAQVGGVVSPGAEFLKSMKTWKGLGSDYEIGYDEPGAQVEEGRSGIARGYVVGDKDGQTKR